MALQKTFVTPAGITVSDAYHRVEGVSLPAKTAMRFQLRSYKEAGNTLPFFHESVHACEYDIAGANPIAQAYEYIKSLPEFAGAVDV